MPVRICKDPIMFYKEEEFKKIISCAIEGLQHLRKCGIGVVAVFVGYPDDDPDKDYFIQSYMNFPLELADDIKSSIDELFAEIYQS